MSQCDFNGSSANEPDHSKLLDKVSRACNPNMKNLGEAARRKESRGQILGQPNKLHRCARNVITRGRISVSDRRLRSQPRPLSCVLLLPDRHSVLSSFQRASVFDIVYVKQCGHRQTPLVSWMFITLGDMWDRGGVFGPWGRQITAWSHSSWDFVVRDFVLLQLFLTQSLGLWGFPKGQWVS